MSKTRQNRQLKNQNAQLEVKNQMLTEELTREKLDNYKLRQELQMLRQELEDMKMCFDTPSLLQTQAGG